MFRKEYLAGHAADGLTGFLAWKFQEKTGISGSEFLGFCESRPGHDVSFIDPFPMEVCFGNIWRQAEMWTPGITDPAQQLLDRCGHSINLVSLPQRLETLACCNCCVGTPGFRDPCMSFCLPLCDYLQTHPDDSLVRRLLSQADPGRHASSVAFIVERLFTTLLLTDSTLSFAAYVYSPAALRRRLPRSHAVVIAALATLAAQHPDVPEPLRRSPELRRCLARLNRAAGIAKRESLRRAFNRHWPRWMASRWRRRAMRQPWPPQLETETLHRLGPADVHWRRDLPGRG